MQFKIAKSIFKKYPKLSVGVLLIKNYNNTKTHKKNVDLLRKEEKIVRKELHKELLNELPHIRVWREAYSSFGAKPKKYKASVEALLRRTLSGEDIPSINNIVNIYNYVSIKYKLPLGADDLDKLGEDIALSFAEGTETFQAIGGDEKKNPSKGEVVYKQGKNILCRRWNWRESEISKIDEHSKNVAIYVESLVEDDSLEKALNELQELLGGDTYILTEEHNALDLKQGVLVSNDYDEFFEVEKKEHVQVKKEKKKSSERKESVSMHWADNLALQIKERVENDPELQKIVKKNGFICYDEKTPSGKIHIGSGRGWVIHDCVAKALRKLGLKGRFILSSDDMDPFDKSNKDLGKEWDKHLGKPFRDIPSPEKGYKSFADYYFSLVTDKFSEWGIEAELESTGERYEKGDFNPQFKKILDNAEKVQQIFAEIQGEDTPAAHKLPINVKCPSCGKISTTKATEWNKEKEEVYFECRNDVVTYTKGCGEKGWISPYNGNAKFPWKVEWAAKWPTVGVVYETAGKDHFTKGGARTVSCRIAVDVLGYPPPLPSNGYKTGKGYEFFTVGGAKMSTSKGMGFAFNEMTYYAPARVLRYLMVKTRPNAVIDFNPYNDNELLLLYGRFDKNEEDYFHSQDDVQKRIYELSHVGKMPKRCPPHIALNTASSLIQIAVFDVEGALKMMNKLSLLPKDITKEETELVKERLDFAKRWVQDFASEQYKFQVQDKISADTKKQLSEKQKKALKQLKEKLSQDLDEKAMFEEFYTITKEVGIEVKDFFSAAYLVIIGKEKGPKLAPFILTIGKEQVQKLLEQL